MVDQIKAFGEFIEATDTEKDDNFKIEGTIKMPTQLASSSQNEWKKLSEKDLLAIVGGIDVTNFVSLVDSLVKSPPFPGF